jgi:hypothetical protein
MDQPTALLASMVVEGITVALLFARSGRGKLARGVGVAALSTLATHPFAWWGVGAAEAVLGYWWAVVVVEALVCLVEAIAYRIVVPLGWPAALGVSVAANGMSTLAGLLYYAVAW